MRDIEYRSRGRRKKRKGCAGCLINFLIFSVLFTILCVFGYKMFTESGLVEKILEARYPVKYREYVETNAIEYSLDENFIYAVIHTESKFDPYAVSSTGARGLMQIQDETAKDCVNTLKIKNYTPDMLFEPEINIRIGCYYLKKLLKMYNGDIKLALAAYNGGPGNVDKWLKDGELTDGNNNLIHIPFKETREYVEKVLNTKQVYDELYINE